MLPRTRGSYFPRLLALLAGGCAAASAAPAGRGAQPARPRVLEAGITSDVTAALQQVTLQRAGSLTFGAGENALPGRREEAVSTRLEFELRPRREDGLDRIAAETAATRLKIRALDEHGKSAGTAVGEVLLDDEGARLVVTLTGVSPRLRELSLVEGELRVYPQVRRLRFHIPWLKDELPQRIDVGGGAATLRRFQLVEADSTLWIAVRPPAGFRVAPLSRYESVVAEAVDQDGNLVNGGAITEISQTVEGAEPEFRFFAPGIRRTPSRLMLDVLCVSGEPQAVPFRFRGIALPVRSP